MGKDGLFIPRRVLEDKCTNLSEKAVISQVEYYNHNGCFESNRSLARRLGVSVTTIKRAIKNLETKGYLHDTEPAKLKRCLVLNRAKSALFDNGEVGPNAPQDRAKMDPEQGQMRPIDRAETDHPSEKKDERRVKEKGNKRGGARHKFIKPTFDEVSEYASSIEYSLLNAQQFIDFYDSNGWRVGKNPMRDWRATVRTWKSREKKQSGETIEEKVARMEKEGNL